jgi:hypothetical protein
VASAVAEGVVTVVSPPIFVADADGVDVAVFRTLAEAEAFIEPPDVRRHDVVVFDGLGRRLAAEVKGNRTHLFESPDAVAHDPALISRITALSDAAHLQIDASLDEWGGFIEAAARAIEAWMRR